MSARSAVTAAVPALLLFGACVAAAAGRVEMPSERGALVAMLALEVPAGSVAEGERVTAEIEFTVDLRGRVVDSHVRAASSPALGASLLEQQRQWVYAVAPRGDECTAAHAFRGVQRIAIERTNGKLHTELKPAEVIELREANRWLNAAEVATNVREVLARIRLPRRALLNNVDASFAVVIEFDAAGKVTDVYPINAAYDEYGMLQSAVKEFHLLQANPAVTQGRPVTVCSSVRFTVR
jgi:hypothetical protein